MSSSLETMSGGTKANKTGNSLENFAEDILVRNGYIEFVNYKKQVFDMRESIYRSAGKCDFLVINQDKFPNNLIIERKWQESAGSVDEKYPFLFEKY